MNGTLRVAVPNKGTLSEPAAEILSEAGYRRRTDPKDLTVVDAARSQPLAALDNDAESTLALALSADGSLAAACEATSIRWWRPGTVRGL